MTDELEASLVAALAETLDLPPLPTLLDESPKLAVAAADLIEDGTVGQLLGDALVPFALGNILAAVGDEQTIATLVQFTGSTKLFETFVALVIARYEQLKA